MRMLWRPSLAIGEVGNVTLKIAMLVALGNPRTLHHQRRALLHSTVARHRHAARRAVRARHELPSRPPAKRAILQSHDFCLCSGRSERPTHFPTQDSIRARSRDGKQSALGKLWKEPVAQALACAHFVSFTA